MTISECLQGGERGGTYQEISRRAVQRKLETVNKCLYGGGGGKPGAQGVLTGYQSIRRQAKQRNLETISKHLVRKHTRQREEERCMKF